MSRLIVALVLVLSIVAVTAQSIQWTTRTDTPAPFYDYGKIDPSHLLELPNFVDGQHQYYLVNNFPAQRDETLDTFAALFSPPTATASITITVARPASTGFGLTFIKSYAVTGLEFGVRKNVNNLGIALQTGDFLLLSVPDDQVKLRVGPNHLGILIRYGVVQLDAAANIFSTATGTYALSAIPTGEHALANGDVLQLCIDYGTIGVVNNVVPSQYVVVFAAEDSNVATANTIRTAGFVKSFEVGLAKLNAAPYPVPISVTLWVAKKDGFGVYHISTAPGRFFTYPGVQDHVTMLTGDELAVAVGDLVGVSLGIGQVFNPPAFIEWTTNAPNSQLTTYYSPFDEDGNLILDGHLSTTDTVSNLLPNFHFTVGEKGGSTLNGDPQFQGFQGQNFQFHGMADEVFNLISTPTFQMNGNFKYLSAGNCNYNDTVCWSHPGTYVDQLGFLLGDVRLKLAASAHDAGLQAYMNDIELRYHHHKANQKIVFALNNSTVETGSIVYAEKGKIMLDTPLVNIVVQNADYFFNLEVQYKDNDVLRAGRKQVKLHDSFLCASDGLKSEERLRRVETRMADFYPRVAMHGLIGQTWRNALICNRAWVGDASDYVTSDLFAVDSAFNYYGTKQ